MALSLSCKCFALPFWQLLVGATVALTGATANAGVLTAVGTDLNDPSWRTATVPKSQDNNGDNIYGTNGYFLPRFNSAGSTVAFTTANNTNGTINTLPSYLTVASAGGATGPNDQYGAKLPIDNPSVAGTTAASGIAFQSAVGPTGTNPFLTFTINTGVPTGTLRIGILSDTSTGNGNIPTSFTLTQTVGTGTGNVTLTDALSPTATTAQADWYFFDIANAVAGDVYTLSLGTTMAVAGAKPTLSGVTLDVVPEPSTWAMLSVGAVGLGLAARRCSRAHSAAALG